jgi:hypothetical protein
MTKVLHVLSITASLMVLLSSSAYAINDITFDLDGPPLVQPVNEQNETVLTKMLNRENARRVAQEPPLPTLTLNQFARNTFLDGVRALRIESGGRDHIDACTRFRALDPDQRAAELARPVWSGDSPCPN